MRSGLYTEDYKLAQTVRLLAGERALGSCMFHIRAAWGVGVSTPNAIEEEALES